MPQAVQSGEHEFRRLTQRAILAVSARCARRVLPLLLNEETGGTHLWPILGSIRLAEHLAGGGFAAPGDVQEAQDALELKSEANLWRNWSSARTTKHVTACVEHVAMATRFVAAAVAYQAKESKAEQSAQERDGVPRAAAIAVQEALAAIPTSGKEVTGLEVGPGGTLKFPTVHVPANRFWIDYIQVTIEKECRTLASNSDEAFKTLGEPVNASPQGKLGPLWSGNAPSWFQAESPLGQLAQVWPAGNFPPGFVPSPAWESLSRAGLQALADVAAPAASSVEPALFVAAPHVAALALRCRDMEHPDTTPDLTVSSRRVIPYGRAPDKYLDVVQEAIGERLVRLVTGLAAQAGLGQEKSQPVLILLDQEHFAPPVEGTMVKRLGLSLKAQDYPAFHKALACNFYTWLKENDETRKEMRGEFRADKFYLHSPVLRRRASRK